MYSTRVYHCTYSIHAFSDAAQCTVSKSMWYIPQKINYYYYRIQGLEYSGFFQKFFSKKLSFIISKDFYQNLRKLRIFQKKLPIWRLHLTLNFLAGLEKRRPENLFYHFSIHSTTEAWGMSQVKKLHFPVFVWFLKKCIKLIERFYPVCSRCSIAAATNWSV